MREDDGTRSNLLINNHFLSKKHLSGPIKLAWHIRCINWGFACMPVSPEFGHLKSGSNQMKGG